MDLYFKIKRENLLKLKHSNNELYKIVMTHLDEDKNKDVVINNKNEDCIGRESYINIKGLDKYNHLKNINDGLDETQIIFDKALIKYLSINKIDIVKNNDIENLFIKRTHFDIHCIRLILEVMPELANQISKELCIDRGQLLLFANQTPISRFIVYQSLVTLNLKENITNIKASKHQILLDFIKENPNAKIRIPCTNLESINLQPLLFEIGCKWAGLQNKQNYSIRVNFYCLDIGYHNSMELTFTPNKNVLEGEYIYDLKTEKFINEMNVSKHNAFIEFIRKNPTESICFPFKNKNGRDIESFLLGLGYKWNSVTGKQEDDFFYKK